VKNAMLRSKKRAAKKGLEHDIDGEYIGSISGAVCPVFGTTLSYDRPEDVDNLPSLDRIDSSKGYLKGNVAVISNRANRIKNDLSLEELRLLVEKLEAKIGSTI
jgi:hypothetical protein